MRVALADRTGVIHEHSLHILFDFHGSQFADSDRWSPRGVLINAARSRLDWVAWEVGRNGREQLLHLK
eukprot:4013128-Prorocentrum_lima.AAC.1